MEETPKESAVRPALSGWAQLIIAGVLVSQIWLPLSYYLGDDPFDERFSWRMFSPVRMARCQVSATDHSAGQAERIRLGSKIHVVWVNLLKRARPSVIEAVSEKLCADTKTPAPDIRLSIVCTEPNAVTLGVCLNPRDDDGDGIPDGYNSSRFCDEPEVCFQADCQGESPEACYQRRCRTVVVSGEQNACEGRDS